MTRYHLQRHYYTRNKVSVDTLTFTGDQPSQQVTARTVGWPSAAPLPYSSCSKQHLPLAAAAAAAMQSLSFLASPASPSTEPTSNLPGLACLNHPDSIFGTHRQRHSANLPAAHGPVVDAITLRRLRAVKYSSTLSLVISCHR